MDRPTREQVIAVRKSANLSQVQAAGLLYINVNTWRNWEAGSSAIRQSVMSAANWELFCLKVFAINEIAEKRDNAVSQVANAAMLRFSPSE
jgi:transcriptional regulator with XRE-family HTH domain